jgi:hypothetical protein
MTSPRRFTATTLLPSLFPTRQRISDTQATLRGVRRSPPSMAKLKSLASLLSSMRRSVASETSRRLAPWVMQEDREVEPGGEVGRWCGQELAQLPPGASPSGSYLPGEQGRGWPS